MPVIQTFNDQTMREDFRELAMLGDENTAMFNVARKAVAEGTTTKWAQDSLTDANPANAAVQGATFAFNGTSIATKMSNETQIFKQETGVSRSVLDSKRVMGGLNNAENELAYQIMKGKKQNIRDADSAFLFNNSQVATATLPGLTGGIVQQTDATHKVTSATATLAWSDVDDAITLIVDAGANPDTAIASNMKAMIAQLNRNQAPYQTVIVNTSGDNKEVQGSAVAFEGTAGKVMIEYDPRQVADTIAIFDKSLVENRILGEANRQNPITFDGVGSAIILECALALLHSKAAAILTLATA